MQKNPRPAPEFQWLLPMAARRKKSISSPHAVLTSSVYSFIFFGKGGGGVAILIRINSSVDQVVGNGNGLNTLIFLRYSGQVSFFFFLPPLSFVHLQRGKEVSHVKRYHDANKVLMERSVVSSYVFLLHIAESPQKSTRRIRV